MADADDTGQVAKPAGLPAVGDPTRREIYRLEDAKGYYADDNEKTVNFGPGRLKIFAATSAGGPLKIEIGD